MTRGPVPPHERAWRHPSELAAPPHEPTSRLGHTLIASTATVGLVLVGVLVLSMTPDRLGAPGESLTDSTDIVVAPNPASGDGSTTIGGTESAADHVLRAVATFLNATTSPANVTDTANPADPTGTATTVLATSPAGDVVASGPPVALVTADSTRNPEPSSATQSTSAGTPSSEPVVASRESAFTTQAVSTVDDGFQAVDGAPLGLTESTESFALIAPTSSTSSTISTTSTSTTSTSTTSTTTTTGPATSTTLAWQAKQLG